MVLPSNDSLHEDLILEELEVFQVSSASLPLRFHHFLLCEIKERWRRGGAGGVQELSGVRSNSQVVARGNRPFIAVMT